MTAKSLVSTGCERLTPAVPFAGIDVLCTSKDRTQFQDGDFCGPKIVVRGDTRWTYVYRPRMGGGKNKLLWRFSEEAIQEEIRQR